MPLIIAPPPGRRARLALARLAGRRVRGLARLVDVTPTVLDLVGLPVPAGLDGASLLPMVAHETAGAGCGSRGATGRRPRTRSPGRSSYAETYYPRFHYGWSELFAVETERWKFVRAPRPELYDLPARTRRSSTTSTSSTRASPRRWPRSSRR